MPKFYIGSSSLKRIQGGYHGSVSSKKYKVTWNNELKEHPDLFKTEILSTHETRKDALEAEHALQIYNDVVRNETFINRSLATVNGFHGSDVSGENNPMFGKGYKLIGSKNGMYNVHRNGDLSLGRRGTDHHCFGRTGEKHPMFGKHGSSNPNFGKIWVTNDTEQFFVCADEAESLLKRGFRKGMKTSTNKRKLTGAAARIIICPHCNKSGGMRGMQRWHFENCKSLLSVVPVSRH